MLKKPYHPVLVPVFTVALAACIPPPDPQDEFFFSLEALCGHSYEGEVVESIESDETWRTSRIVIYVDECSENEIRIPLHVGEDTSRTWIISKTETGLRLKHDHRHEDGTPDDVTMYGGDTVEEGTPYRQAFPADDYSKALFVENDIAASVNNTWILMITPDETLSYRLQRPGRTFQVNFDLTQPIR